MAGAPPSKTLARGLDVLDMVLHADPPVRLKDVAERLQMDMASAHRMLRTLEVSGYLTRGQAERSYRPGEKIWGLLHRLPSTKDTIANLHPCLQELTETTGQIAHVGVLERGRVVLADVALTASARVSVLQSAGDTEDVYCSAIGKVLAAFAPDSRRKALLDAQSFETHTDFTISGRDVLEAELNTVRNLGLAFDDREGSLDVSCIAAPVKDPSGCSTIAIGISTVAQNLSGNIRDRDDWAASVLEAATRAGTLIA